MHALHWRLGAVLLGLTACGGNSEGVSGDSEPEGAAPTSTGVAVTETEAGSLTSTTGGVSGATSESEETEAASADTESSGGVDVPMMVFEGSVTIENAEDIEEMFVYTHITGDLRVDAPGLEQVALPHLQEVGEVLSVVEDEVAGCQDIDFPTLATVGGFDFDGDISGSAGRRCAIKLPSLNGLTSINFTRGVSSVDLSSADDIEISLYRTNLELLDVSGMTTGSFLWADTRVEDLRADALLDAFVHLNSYEGTSFELPNVQRLGLEVEGPYLETLSFPSATDLDPMTIFAATDLVTVNAPLATAFLWIRIQENTSLENLNVPELAEVLEPRYSDLFGSIFIQDNSNLSNCDLQTLRDGIDNTYVSGSNFEGNDDSSCPDPAPLPDGPYLGNCTFPDVCGFPDPSETCSCDLDCADGGGFYPCCPDVAAECG